jgi:cellulose biosynthesis protein BcsQ
MLIAKHAVRALLLSLKDILGRQAKLLMDTSPFYSGGTRLAWCAADALIVPVRVDEHSIESFELLLDLLCRRRRSWQLS